MVLRFDDCCLCVDLRIGSLIFGYLHLMKDIIQILASMIILIINLIYRTPYNYRGEEPTITYSATYLTFGIITLIFTILLLKGLNQYRPVFVKAFLIYSVISTVIYSIIALVLICTNELFVLFVPGLLFLALYIYFLLVIGSYYPKMDNAEMKSAIFNTPAESFVE